jgi:uncharacterized protein (DUF302 family)
MYYLNKKVQLNFEEADQKIREVLKKHGFGILTEINFSETLKNKIDKDLGKQYKILGACNPNFAYQAYQQEEKIGIMLPCNVTLIETEEGTDISIMDPVAAFKVVDNPNIEGFANEVKAILEQALNEV